DHILNSLGFGYTWCSWIKSCLSSSRASILVNGSPTSEFSINHSLRQGDPLSPFLFILVMEGLHNAFTEAVGVNYEEVYNMASNAGCTASNIPFNYLGLPIGSNMKSTTSWKVLVDRFCSRLSTWKANLLSIGGHLTLIKSVLGSLAGCGTRIRFWKDIWVGEAPLFIRTNLGARNPSSFCDMLNEIGQVNIEVSEDTYVWSLGPKGTFTRLSLDRLPHRLNLSLRGMDILTISCSSCNANVESANHVFFECTIASDMWKLVYRWCDIPFVQALSFKAFKDWFSSWHAPKDKKHKLYVISASVLW
ncbi:RNA-directed DNA polymerase, eukaryota, partial [Tanacetum coccineum]